jgi:hypothetical protein
MAVAQFAARDFSRELKARDLKKALPVCRRRENFAAQVRAEAERLFNAPIR